MKQVKLFLGVDLITGEPLAGWQRALCALGAVAPLLVQGGKLIYQGIKGAKAAEAINEINKGVKVGEAVASVSTKNAAEEIGKLFNGVVQKADGSGWKITIPSKSGRPVVVRVMEAGSGGRPSSYFRVSIDGKGSLDLAGKISDQRALTHIDLTDKYLDEIKNMVNNYWEV